MSAAEGTIVVTATGGAVLAALIAFGFWWFRPFRSGSRRELQVLDDEERDRGEPPRR
ncbi:MAG TPA: hypothetical protein VHT29_03355 [Solirubrobacteraceae bacterium]|nr:hypothetical protein [Solirubrobacteraceae bacterium]